jgi:FKBP-type peptidyl-prolyl cis-trans isomerase FklB
LPAVTSIALAANKADFKTEQAKAAYIMGHQTGANFKKNGVDLDADAFMKGVKEGAKGSESAFSTAETQKIMEAFQKEVTEKRTAIQEKEGKANKEEGAKFLEANKKKPGVKVTASGLQYKVIKEGTGAKPKETDTVTTHYKGTLINGKVFDSSYDRGEPATFPVTGVIKGWTEALQMMQPGAKYELYVPSELAYGARGAGADIGPDATLIFEVELISIKAKDEAKK